MNRKGLYFLLPVRCVIFFLIFTVGAHIAGKTPDEISGWWSAAASVVNILTILILIAAAKFRGGSYRELINFHKGRSGIKKVLIGIIGSVVGMSGMYLSGLIFYGTVMPEVSLIMIAPVPAVFAVINTAVLPVTTALAEDGLYLGAGTGSIENKYASIAVPAFFYAVQHCFIPFMFDLRYLAYRAFSFLPLAIAFCICYRRNKDPLPLMAGHTVLDLATASGILAMSVIPGAYEQMHSMI